MALISFSEVKWQIILVFSLIATKLIRRIQILLIPSSIGRRQLQMKSVDEKRQFVQQQNIQTKWLLGRLLCVVSDDCRSA